MNPSPYKFKWLQFFIALLCGCFLLTSISYASQSEKSAVSASHQNNSSLTPVKVQINWNHQYQFAGFYAAIKEGYYQQAGLDVTIKDWKPGIGVADEVVSGNADFGVGKVRMIVDYAQGKPLSAVSISSLLNPIYLFQWL